MSFLDYLGLTIVGSGVGIDHTLVGEIGRVHQSGDDGLAVGSESKVGNGERDIEQLRIAFSQSLKIIH
jgi:hypothetical protein